MSQPLSPSANAEYHTLFNSNPPFRDDHHRLLSRWRLQFDWPSFSHSIGHSYSFCYRLIVNPVAYGAYPQQLINTMNIHSTAHATQEFPVSLHTRRPKHSHSVHSHALETFSSLICSSSGWTGMSLSQSLSPSANTEYHTLFNSKPPISCCSS